MTLRESIEAVPMERVAIVAPTEHFEEVLAAVEGTGAVQIEQVPTDATVSAAMSAAIRHDALSALVGWSPRADVVNLREVVVPHGGAIATLPPPPGVVPPTLVAPHGPGSVFQPLVDTYTTIPYRDINPALFAGAAYVVMFGMMFGDVGDGALLVVAGLVLWLTGRPRRLAGVRHLAPFVVGGGLCATTFGVLYGEAFGPTHLVPTLWVAPLSHATTLLAVGIAVGVVLLAVAFGLGSVNRWREGGPARSLVDMAGLAGAATYLGLGLVIVGWYERTTVALVAGSALALVGLASGFVGCYAREGGVVSAIELFDSVIRMGTNTVSFARLAAFGLTHAALEQVVWTGTVALSRRGGALWALAVALFVLGNAAAFALEALVAGIQALRLNYYELFSRVFVSEGQPFRPWRTAPRAPTAAPVLSPVRSSAHKEEACSPG